MFFIIVFLIHFPFSSFQTVVSGSLNSNVLLPCNFSGNGGQVDLKYTRVIWKQNAKEIVRYESEKLEVASKAKISEAELRHGNASLFLPQVIIADEGDYECEVNYASEHYNRNVRFNVIAYPKVSMNPPLVVMNEKSLLECRVDNFFPKGISIEWLRDSQSLYVQDELHLEHNPDGTFSTVSLFSYTPTPEDHGVAFCCRVKHECQMGPLEETFHLQFRKRASVKLTSIDLPQGRKLITCIAEDFYPADVNMTWKKNGLPVNSTEEKADGSFEKREYHILVDTEMESEYTCEVSQEGFLNSLAENRFTKSEVCGNRTRTVVITIFVLLIIEVVLVLVGYFLYKKYYRKRSPVAGSSGSPSVSLRAMGSSTATSEMG
ncbi:tyrosine-protein phosphatase non-receptor type substrate 1-like [Erpetoichthys calabaricus]|uniref:tyrosine-protein phosphatase non-receptor type substrate 1-like n=1 Tax=Erpetoichthys calabaricus TaxID=27687 RepID=UPI00109F5862|nr:tyrosine-protein phosphatase non-receptor type substrate 1-like [Erpetoichthys calabaricus]